MVQVSRASEVDPSVIEPALTSLRHLNSNPSYTSMSLLYVIAGVVSGEKGHVLLHCAGIFLAQVKKRIELAEKTPSRDWARLQIAVLNNQIFVSNELCLHDQAKEQVTEMTKRLCGASKVLDVTVWQEFALNLQCLNRTGTVALAA